MFPRDGLLRGRWRKRGSAEARIVPRRGRFQTFPVRFAVARTRGRGVPDARCHVGATLRIRRRRMFSRGAAFLETFRRGFAFRRTHTWARSSGCSVPRGRDLADPPTANVLEGRRVSQDVPPRLRLSSHAHVGAESRVLGATWARQVECRHSAGRCGGAEGARCRAADVLRVMACARSRSRRRVARDGVCSQSRPPKCAGMTA
jgi:hypothetical protein